MIRCPICNGTGQQPVLQIDDADRLIGISSKTCGICGGTCQVPAHPNIRKLCRIARSEESPRQTSEAVTKTCKTCKPCSVFDCRFCTFSLIARIPRQSKPLLAIGRSSDEQPHAKPRPTAGRRLYLG